MCCVPVYDVTTFSGDNPTVRNYVIGQFAAYTANATGQSERFFQLYK